MKNKLPFTFPKEAPGTQELWIRRNGSHPFSVSRYMMDECHMCDTLPGAQI